MPRKKKVVLNQEIVAVGESTPWEDAVSAPPSGFLSDKANEVVGQEAVKVTPMKANPQTATPARRPREKLLDRSGPLNCKPMPGWHGRWVSINDPRQPGNMAWAYGQGYEKVHPSEQNIINDSCDTKDIGSDIRVTGGDGITQVLMKNPIEYYEEAIQEITQENDRQVSRVELHENSQTPIYRPKMNTQRF